MTLNIITLLLILLIYFSLIYFFFGLEGERRWRKILLERKNDLMEIIHGQGEDNL